MPRWVNALLVVIAIATGLCIPEFYDWTGADQSRPAPVVGWIALSILAADCGLFAWLAWIHYSRKCSCQNAKGTGRFSIGQLLSATSIIAVLMVIGRWSSRDIAAVLLHVLVLCFSLGMAIRFSEFRWQILTVIVCQSAPFLWTLRHGSAVNSWSATYAMFFVYPAFLEAILVSSWFQQHFDRNVWLSMLLTASQLAVGVWLSVLGPKRAFAYCALLLTLSLFGSFVLHALMRA